jgi:thiamine-phosphate pyrophosphorylase
MMRYDLYVVTDDRLSNGLSHVEIAERAYEGGADVVQLRAKDCDDRQLLKWAKEISEISERFGAGFIVNDRLDIALASGADGVHLGQSDMSASDARELSPEGFVIGVSVGDVKEALEAEKDGASYVALSPIFDTASKDDAGAGHGLNMLKAIRSAVKIPVIAIGGINKENVESIIDAGADGVAVISAVVSQPDVSAAAKELRALITASKARR